jgi:type IV pilus assembly protein PilE
LTHSLHRTNRGFTLVELMITVTIIGLLGAVALPSYYTYVEKGRRTECKAGLLQAMQSQERYYTQFNTYKEIASTNTAPPLRNFSGDLRESSSCLIDAAACTATGASTDIAKCIELKGTLQKPDAVVSEFYYDSNTNKRCKLSGASAVVTDSKCW